MTQHHRAIYDAETTAHIFVKMLKQIEQLGVTNHNEIDAKLSNQDAYKRARPMHVTLIVQNQTGLKTYLKLSVNRWCIIFIVHHVFQDLY